MPGAVLPWRLQTTTALGGVQWYPGSSDAEDKELWPWLSWLQGPNWEEASEEAETQAGGGAADDNITVWVEKFVRRNKERLLSPHLKDLLGVELASATTMTWIDHSIGEWARSDCDRCLQSVPDI